MDEKLIFKKLLMITFKTNRAAMDGDNEAITMV